MQMQKAKNIAGGCREMKSEQEIRDELKQMLETQEMIPMHDKLLWLTNGKIAFAKWVLEEEK